MIGLGIALNKYARGMPGWGKDSYGVHSDDGFTYTQCGFAGLPCTEPWHEGDTLGMGINYATKSLFVTRNGLLLGTIAQRVRNLSHMHVTVAVKRVDTKCRVNFGQRPFMFDLVEYLRTLEVDPAINSKWPFKLYSQIVQELEETALDSESLDEVDPEVISATNYYENDLAPNKEGDLNDERDPEEIQRAHYLEVYYSKLELLLQRHIAEAVSQNREDIRKILADIINFLELPIDPNHEPLSDLMTLTHDTILLTIGEQFTVQLQSERTRRLAKEKNNPNLKKRTWLELSDIYAKNAVLMLANEEFAVDHPLLTRLVQKIAESRQIVIQDTDQLTEDDRNYVCFVTAFEEFEKQQRAAKKRAGNFDADKQKSGNDFCAKFGNSIYGLDLNDTATTLRKQADEEYIVSMLAESTLSEEDLFQFGNEDEEISDKPPWFEEVPAEPSFEEIWAAQDYCQSCWAASFGQDQPMDHYLLDAILWWYLAMEEQLDPSGDLREYSSKYIQKASKKREYYESDKQRYEMVIRGTIEYLKNSSKYDPTQQLVPLMAEMWAFTVKDPNAEDKDLMIHIISGLEMLLEKFDIFYEFVQDQQKTKLLTRSSSSKNNQMNTNNKKNNNRLKSSHKDNTENVAENGSSSFKSILTVLSVVTSVAVLGTVVYWFKKKSAK